MRIAIAAVLVASFATSTRADVCRAADRCCPASRSSLDIDDCSLPPPIALADDTDSAVAIRFLTVLHEVLGYAASR